METKAELLELPPDSPAHFDPVVPEPFTKTVLDALDKEIASVFPRNEIITPDDVRGRHATLPEAMARRRDAVMSSGAQILSTDHPAGEGTTEGDVVSLPGGMVARCNPVTSTAACSADLLN